MSLMIAILLAAEPMIVKKAVVEAAPVGSIEFPDEIAPAIIPYLRCMQTEFNRAQAAIEQREEAKGLSKALTEEANGMATKACQSTRERATREGLRLSKAIENSSPEQRTMSVLIALSRIDRMYAQLFDIPLDPPEYTPNIPKGMVAGLLDDGGLLFPHQIGDQQLRYAACIRDTLLGPTRIAPSNLTEYRRKTDAAISTCVETKREATIEAKEILRKSPDFASVEAADEAVDATFAAVEEQQRKMPEIMEMTRKRMRARD